MIINLNYVPKARVITWKHKWQFLYNTNGSGERYPEISSLCTHIGFCSNAAKSAQSADLFSIITLADSPEMKIYECLTELDKSVTDSSLSVTESLLLFQSLMQVKMQPAIRPLLEHRLQSCPQREYSKGYQGVNLPRHK